MRNKETIEIHYIARFAEHRSDVERVEGFVIIDNGLGEWVKSGYGRFKEGIIEGSVPEKYNRAIQWSVFADQKYVHLKTERFADLIVGLSVAPPAGEFYLSVFMDHFPTSNFENASNKISDVLHKCLKSSIDKSPEWAGDLVDKITGSHNRIDKAFGEASEVIATLLQVWQ